MQEKSSYKIISRHICAAFVFFTILFRSFAGELYLSENGYMLFQNSICFTDPIPETFHSYSTVYEAMVNGEHIYIIHYQPPFYEGTDKIPMSSFENYFSVLTEHYGVVDFAIYKDQGTGEVNYRFTEDGYEEVYVEFMEPIYSIMDMVMDFFETCWQHTGLSLIAYSSVNEGRNQWMLGTLTLILAFQVAVELHVKKLEKTGSCLKKQQLISYTVCGILQLAAFIAYVFRYVTIV